MISNRSYELSPDLKLILVAILFFVTVLSIFTISCNAHILNSNNTQIWNNTERNLKIEFDYLPEKPIIDTFTNLQFSVTNLQNGNHIEDGVAQVTVTNGQRLFKFENLSVQNGDFSVDYLFPDDGTHQVLLRLDRNDSINLVSFQVFVPHQSPPELLSNTHNVIIALTLISAVAVITIFMIRRK